MNRKRRLKRKKKHKRVDFYLLYREEEGHKVFLYEKLRRYELNSKIRKGWKIL